MKVTIETNAKQVETANYILRVACEQLEANPEAMNKMGLKASELKSAKIFRQALVKGLLDTTKK